MATAAAALLAFAPAEAADPAGLPCPMDRLSEQHRRVIGAAIASVGARDERAATAFDQALTNCAAELAWNEVETEAAGRFALSTLGEAVLRPAMAADGIDIAALERLIAADSQLAAAVRRPEFQESDVQSFAQRNLAAIQQLLGAKVEDREAATRIGRFIAARAIVTASRIRFAGQ